MAASRRAAQQGERVRRIGVLMSQAANDTEGQARVASFLQGLQELGWSVGRNAQIDTRWSAGNAEDVRKYAAELVALASDVILSNGTPAVAALLQATRTVPIVFTAVADPVGAGFVDSLARPGGNATGFISLEYGLSAKWMELLKEIAPGTTRAAVLRDPTITAGIGQFAAIQTAAPSLGVEASPINVRDAGEIESAVAAFARSANGGLIVTGSPLTALHRDLIVTLAARHKLPAVYSNRLSVAAGGADLLWDRSSRPAPARRRLRRSHPQGREARRPAGAGADQVQARSSTSRPPRRLASKFRRRCSPAPTR